MSTPALFHQEIRRPRRRASIRKFIEEHWSLSAMIERYLENKLPFKGARDLRKLAPRCTLTSI